MRSRTRNPVASTATSTTVVNQTSGRSALERVAGDIDSAGQQQRRQAVGPLVEAVHVFARLGWNDGKTEDFVFSESDRTLAGGVQTSRVPTAWPLWCSGTA